MAGTHNRCRRQNFLHADTAAVPAKNTVIGAESGQKFGRFTTIGTSVFINRHLNTPFETFDFKVRISRYLIYLLPGVAFELTAVSQGQI
jgi:hypothetical protein